MVKQIQPVMIRSAISGAGQAPDKHRISDKGYEKCRRDNEEERACSQAGTAQGWVPG